MRAGVKLGKHLALSGVFEIGRGDGGDGRAVVVGRGLDERLGFDDELGVTFGDVEVVNRVTVKIAVILRGRGRLESQVEVHAFLEGVVDGAETHFVEAVVRFASVGESRAVKDAQVHGPSGVSIRCAVDAVAKGIIA